jgi:hypothetical protein
MKKNVIWIKRTMRKEMANSLNFQILNQFLIIKFKKKEF